MLNQSDRNYDPRLIHKLFYNVECRWYFSVILNERDLSFCKKNWVKLGNMTMKTNFFFLKKKIFQNKQSLLPIGDHESKHKFQVDRNYLWLWGFEFLFLVFFFKLYFINYHYFEPHICLLCLITSFNF